MKKSKKIAALVLTTAMAAGGMTSVYASAPTTAAGETTVSGSAEVKGAGDTSMLLTGTIKVTNLKVTIPTAVSFNVDMTQIPAKNASTREAVNVQVGQPSTDVYRIINNSASSVWVYVTGVTTEGVTGTAPTLVNNYADVATTNHNLMFAIKDMNAAAPKVNNYTNANGSDMTIGDAAYWMKSNMGAGEKYYLNSTNGKLVAQDQATSAKENEMGLVIYAFTRKGWTAGDKFNVTPVFTVSVEDPNPVIS